MKTSKTRFWLLVTLSFFIGLIGKMFLLGDASSKLSVLHYLSLPFLMAVATFLFILWLDKKEKKGLSYTLILSILLINSVLILDLSITGKFPLLQYFLFFPILITIPFIVALLYGGIVYFNLEKLEPPGLSIKYALYGILIGMMIFNILGIFHYIPVLNYISNILFGTRGIYYIGFGHPNPLEGVILTQFITGAYFWASGAIIGFIIGKIKEGKK